MYIVFFKASCPFSRHARNLLDASPYDYDLCDVSQWPKTKYIDALKKRGVAGHTTYPAIFDGRHFVGGCEELEIALAHLKEDDDQ